MVSQTIDAYVPSATRDSTLLWTGCHGSTDHYRGYPCSLWITFHSLTTAACDMGTGGKTQ